MTDLIIGVDPGNDGALALYDFTNAKVLSIVDMPCTERILTTGKKLREINGKELLKLFHKYRDYALENNADIFCHIEKVQGFSKQSAVASFNFGKSACWPEAFCVVLGIEYRLISPQQWKKQMGLIVEEKDAARQLVLKIFPYCGKYLKRKKDVDRADAVLLAMYKP